MKKKHQSEVCLSHLGAVVPANSFIDLIDYDRHVLKTLTEEVQALGSDLLKLLITLPGCFSAGFKG